MPTVKRHHISRISILIANHLVNYLCKLCNCILYVFVCCKRNVFFQAKNYELTSEIRFKICAGKVISSAAATRGTWEQDCSGLCELCYNKEAEVECASCGPVRVNSTGAFEVKMACSSVHVN